MTDLTEFGLAPTPPPLVRREACKQSPHTGKLCGFIGRDVRREKTVYATRRGGWHYYREGEGYAVSDVILDSLDEAGVSRILVYENPEDGEVGEAVYEFQPHVYADEGKHIPEDYLVDTDDPQTYVPVTAAMNEWADHAEDLFVHTFETAMDRIGWRGFDPNHPARTES